MKLRILLFAMFPVVLHGLSVGSNTAVSRQAQVMFPALDTDNTILGFASLGSGFLFEDGTTGCTYNALYPVTGTIDLKCGDLFLLRNLILGKGASLVNIGSIYGNGYSIKTSSDIGVINAQNNYILLTQADQKTLASYAIYSIDWNSDGTYIVICCANDGAGVQEYIYSVSRSTGVMTLAASGGLVSRPVNSVCCRWNPVAGSGYIAVGGAVSSTNLVHELQIWQFTAPSTLTEASNIQNRYYGVPALAWNPLGTRLAAAWDVAAGGANFTVYTFSAGTLSAPTSVAFAAGEHASINAATWDPTGAYIVVGTSVNLKIFYYNGSTVVTQNTLATTPDTVNAVNWSKTGNFIAIGTNNATTNQLRVYSYDTGTNTLTLKAQLSVAGPVLSVHWNSTATLLAVGMQSLASDREFALYSYDGNASLVRIKSKEFSANVNAVRWDFDNSHVLACDATYHITDLNVPPPLYKTGFSVNNLLMSVANTLSWNTTTTFYGSCIIDGQISAGLNTEYQSQMITLGSSAKFVVAPNSNVAFRNLTLAGVKGTNIACLDNSSSVSFINCSIWLQDNFTFTNGSIYFSGDVVWGGTYTFTYASIMGSTVAANTNLYFSPGFTFSYGPRSTSEQLLNFVDNSAQLTLDGASLYTSGTNLSLRTGKMIVQKISYLAAKDGSTIKFGNDNAAEDFTCFVNGGAMLMLQNGKFEYRNVTTSNFVAGDTYTFMDIYSGATLDLYETFNFGYGILRIEDTATLRHISTATIGSSVFGVGRPYYAVF